MHITVDPRDDHAILHLRGEFDTYYCPLLAEEIEAVQRSGIQRVVLNLRMVKFINSTALGAILKASKALTAQGGKLVISRPSPFCRDILEKVGLDRVVHVYDSDEDAAAALADAPAQRPADGPGFEEDPSSVLFRLVDQGRMAHFVEQQKAKNPVHGHAFGSNWSGVGRMSGLTDSELSFTWNGGSTDLSPFEMGQMLAVGTELSIKFRLPLLQRGYCEAVVSVEYVEERAESVKVGAAFSRIDDTTREAVAQYAQDMRFLKDELKRATDA